MVEHFSHIRKKTRISAVLTAAVIAIGVGAVSASAVLFLTKSLLIEADAWTYLACGMAALITFCISCFVLLPSDKRLAKSLDEKYSLDERVRTMVEFRGSDDTFANLQREDTNDRLGKIKVGLFNKKQAMTIIVTVAIAITSFTGATLMPKKGSMPPEESPISKFDKELIIAELSELVSTVESSIMTEELKIDTVKALNGLIEFVGEHEYMSEMKLEAITTVVVINNALDGVNSAPKIGAVMAESSNTVLKELGLELVRMSGSKAKKLLEELEDEMSGADSEDMSFTADELGAVLDRIQADKNNTLVRQLSNLASALRSCANGIGEIEDAFSGLPLALSNEVMVQNVNKMTTQTVISKLCDIFAISPDDLSEAEGGDEIDIRPPSELSPDEEETEIEEPDNPIGEGGIGSGDRIYGSNDVIYDPHSNAYVTYGTLLDEYNAKATDKILDGRINEDFKKFIEEYFKSLSEYTPSET